MDLLDISIKEDKNVTYHIKKKTRILSEISLY